MGMSEKPREGDVIEEECPGCETETKQEVVSVLYDGSGYARCQSCEKLIVNMAGSFKKE